MSSEYLRYAQSLSIKYTAVSVEYTLMSVKYHLGAVDFV
jgi:hypothetical protein